MTTDSIQRMGQALMALGVLSLLLTTMGCGSTAGETSRNRYTEAVDLQQDGDLMGAARAYREAIAEKPDDYRAHFNLATVHHDLFDAEIAAKAGKKADAKARAQAGAEVMKTSEHYQVARDEYQKTLAIDAGNPRALSGLAVLMADSGDAAGAMRFLDEAKTNGDEGAANVQWTRASILMTTGDVAGATEAYRKVLEADEKHLPAATALARLLLRASDFDGADKVVSKALSSASLDFTLRLLSGEIALARAKSTNAPADWEAAENRLHAARGLAPKSWQTAYALGETCEAMRRIGPAIENFWSARAEASDLALTRAGEDPAAWHQALSARLMRLYAMLPEWEKANAQSR